MPREESLSIPQDIRDAVDERDQTYCRICGKFLGERRGLHHIEYGGDYVGMGGRRVHVTDKILTVCWLPGDPAYRSRPCHDVVHQQKGVWVPILLTVVSRPGVSAYQLRRWQRIAEAQAASRAP